MEKENKIKKQLLEEIEELRIRLKEAEETLSAVRSGEVDAIVVSGLQGEQVFTLTGAERAYRVLIETMNEGAVTLNQEGIIIYCNQRVSEMIKTPLEKVIGAPMRQFIRASDLPVFDSLIEKGSQEKGKGEVAFIHNDGTLLPVLLSISALQKDNANIYGITITDLTAQKHIEEELRRHRDNLEELVKDRTNELETSNQQLKEEITERKKSEKMLRANEERFRIVAETANDVVYEWDLKQSVQWLGKIDEMLGYEPGEFPRTLDGWAASVHPEDVELTLAAVHAQLEGRAPYGTEYRVRRKDGVYRWWSARGATVRTPDGKAGRFIGSITDITERKKSEKMLRESEEKYRVLVENIPQKIFTKDRRLVYISCNENYARDLGIKPEEIGGKTDYDFFPKELADKYRSDDRRLMESGETEDIEEQYMRSGEKGWIYTVKTPLRDKEGNTIGILGVFSDITGRKKTEAEMLKLNRTLRTISGCNEALMRAEDEARLLDDICRLVVESGGYTSAWVGYAEQDEHKTVRPVAQRGFEPEYVSALNITWADTERGCGPTGKAIRTGEPCITRDILNDPAYLPWRDMALRHGYSSAISFPLLSKGKAFGAMNIYSSEPAPFHEEEVKLLSELAGDLSYGIMTLRGRAELSKAHEKIKEEAEVSDSLLQIVETLNATLDERQLVQTLTKITPHYLTFDRVAVFLGDRDLKSFTFSGGYGYTPFQEGVLLSKTFRKGDFPAIDKLLNNEAVNIENARDTNLFPKDLADTLQIGRMVMVPVSFRGMVMGAIVGTYDAENAFKLKDLTLIKGLADGIAIALHNSRLYRESIERLMELSGKIETIKAMAQLDKEILSSIDSTSILRTVTALVNRIIACDRVAVALMEGDSFSIASEWGRGEFVGKTYSIKGSHCDAFRKNTVPLFIHDIAQDDCLYHKEQGLLGIKSVLLVPIVTKEGVKGFLDIGSLQYGKLASTDLSTAENIASQVAVALENARLYEELKQLLINIITSLASAIDAKSPWTNGHSERVTKYALEIGREMGLNEQDLEDLRLSGLLHDVGKIGTYDILLDKPAKLTDEEFELVKKHPWKGAEILGPIKQLSDIIPGVLHHHEWYDGTGYPDGLKGEEIPLQARILCVADSFDSMTADRPYRRSPGKEYAISEFKRCSGSQFDPEVVKAFLKVL